MSDPYWSTRKLVEEIRAGRVKSRDALEAQIERIKRVDPPYNTVVVLDVEHARREADAADAAVAAGESLGPLHGVAMTVKETQDVAGLRTTCCNPLLKDFRPDSDSAAVERLRKAGAIILGKTNTSSFASDNQSYNELFGTSNNPWDRKRTVGGSSGGSAAALALGLTPLELGSDLAGSIRTPAVYNGVVGHKPSYGIVPLRGMEPPPGAFSASDITVVGPMARDCDDAELGLDVIAGPDRLDAPGYRLQLPKARHSNLEDYRIAVHFDDPVCPVSKDTVACLKRSADALSDAGARVEEAWPKIGFEDAKYLFLQLVAAVNSVGFQDESLERMAERAKEDPELRRIRGGPSQRHKRWLGANERRHRMRHVWSEFFQQWDAILMPTIIDGAFPHDHSEPMHSRTLSVDGWERPYGDVFVWAAIIGAVYLPATAIPLGRNAQGMPIGAQVVGNFLDDRTTLDVGRRLMELSGGFVAPELAAAEPS